MSATGTLDGPRTGAAPFYQGRAWDQQLRPQFTQQYNATIEYQFNNSTSMTVAYVGQLGTHLVVPHEANNPLAGVGPVSTWINANDRRPLAKSLPNVGNIALTESSARMSYNSLQVSGRHRLSGGLELTGFYVWSKSMMDNLGYYGCGSRQLGRRLLAGRLQPARQSRSVVLRCAAQRFASAASTICRSARARSSAPTRTRRWT